MLSLEVQSPLGPLTLCQREGRLVALLFQSSGKRDASDLLLEAERQLTEYFAGKRRAFDLPFWYEGTLFSKAVFESLCNVEYGSLVTYGELAALSGYPRACRAVGTALHTNPLPIFFPCHRVVGKTSPGNYAWGMEKKEFLLRLEGVRV